LGTSPKLLLREVCPIKPKEFRVMCTYFIKITSQLVLPMNIDLEIANHWLIALIVKHPLNKPEQRLPQSKKVLGCTWQFFAISDRRNRRLC